MKRYNWADPNKRVGLIGTVTHDLISSYSGEAYVGLGGILYQAATLCGLKTKAFLFTNIGEDLAPQVEHILSKWPTLDASYMRKVAAPSNHVRLHYPEDRERVEILESVVPAIDSDRVLDGLRYLDMLVTVFNSGYDITLEEWRKIVLFTDCPVWLDIHSLVLSKAIGLPRTYVSLPEWEHWIKDVTYVQANRMELSCMLGHPGKMPTHEDFSTIGAKAFAGGIKAVFITLGRDGVQLMTPGDSQRISISDSVNALETTGCGDVFCAAAVVKLVQGAEPFEAAHFGVRFAARAAEIKGIEETFTLASRVSGSVLT